MIVRLISRGHIASGVLWGQSAGWVPGRMMLTGPVRPYTKGCSGETFVRLLADDARRIVDVA
jgi:hypothetical protein